MKSFESLDHVSRCMRYRTQYAHHFFFLRDLVKCRHGQVRSYNLRKDYCNLLLAVEYAHGLQVKTNMKLGKWRYEIMATANGSTSIINDYAYSITLD